MKLCLWRPGHLQPAKILSLGTSNKCHLQLVMKAEDRSLISRSDVSQMSDQDYGNTLEITWRPCKAMSVDVGTKFGPNLSPEAGKGNTFKCMLWVKPFLQLWIRSGHFALMQMFLLSVFCVQNSNDREPSDDVWESNQKTCIKMKGLSNKKWAC